MQTNLPDFKQLLADWYLLTLENPLYTGVIVLSVWVLTVFYYVIKNSFLNKKMRAVEQVTIDIQGKLDETRELNQHNEEKLTEMTEQLAEEQQLAAEYAARTDDRNQQIVENIKQLASKFNLSEQLVASDEKPKVEFVWQQQDNIQMQLSDRLLAESQEKNTLQNTYNQEKEQFSKQKALIEQLQKTLDGQTSKTEQLERDLGTQKLIQQQQKNQLEQKVAAAVSDIQAKHELAVAALVSEIEQQKASFLATAEAKQVVETEALPEVSVSQVISEEVSQVQESALEAEVKQEELKASIEAETELVDEIVAQEPEPEPEPEVLGQPIPPVVEEVLEEPDYTQSSLDITDKFKSLFAKANKQADQAEAERQPEVIELKEPVPIVEEVEEEPDYTQSNLDIAGKFKGLFGKGKENTESGQQAEVLAGSESIEPEPDYSESNLDISGKFKNLFGKGNKQVDKAEVEQQSEAIEIKEPAPAVEEAEDEPDYTQSKLDITGKFKGLFAKGKEKAEKIEPKLQAEVPAAEVTLVEAERLEPGPEEQAFEPDYTKSNFHVPTKFKKLFGKS